MDVPTSFIATTPACPPNDQPYRAPLVVTNVNMTPEEKPDTSIAPPDIEKDGMTCTVSSDLQKTEFPVPVEAVNPAMTRDVALAAVGNSDSHTSPPSTDACAAVLNSSTAFTDLNADVLRHILSFLGSPPPTLGVHWLNVPQVAWSDADIRAMRNTCRHTRDAIPPRRTTVCINNDVDTEAQLCRWAGTPQDVLDSVWRIVLPPSSRGDAFVSHAVAQANFDTALSILTRCPSLSSLEISHNPFCPHDAYGLGTERLFSLHPSPSQHHLPILLRSVSTLSVALKCRICSVELTRTISGFCPNLISLRAPVVTFVPPARVLPALLSPLSSLPSLPSFASNCKPSATTSSLRVLHLKVGDEWGLPAILSALSPCKALEELHVAPYDASRKVAVVHSFHNPEGVFGLGLGLSSHSPSLESFLEKLATFRIKELDLCLSPKALDESIGEDEERGELWREKAMKAAERLIQTCPSLRKSWWWVQVVDLDYRQLKGYERWEWTVEDGELKMVDRPQWLAPLVVRNQDGQGTTVVMPSEEWG